MPLSPTPNMLLVRPQVGGDADQWGTLLNTLIALIDSHTHITGQGAKVPSAGLNINAALSFQSHAAYDLGQVEFIESGALLISGARDLFVFSGDLYYRNATGSNVRITTGAALSMTTVGGIAGDYTAVGAELAFVDSIDTFTLKQQIGAGVRQWAKIQSSDLALFEYKGHPAAGVPANSVTLKSPASLAASYSLTMPGALPGSQQLAQITSAGVVTLSNTIPNTVTLTGGATIPSAASLIMSAGSTLQVSGLADFLNASNLRLPPRTLLVNVSCGLALNAGLATYQATSTILFSGSTLWDMPVNMHSGDRITDILVYYARNSGTTISFTLYEVDMFTTVTTAIVSKSISTGTGNTSTQIGVSPTTGALPYTLVNAKSYVLTASMANTDRLIGARIIWDRP